MELNYIITEIAQQVEDYYFQTDKLPNYIYLDRDSLAKVVQRFGWWLTIPILDLRHKLPLANAIPTPGDQCPVAYLQVREKRLGTYIMVQQDQNNEPYL